jgi:hypothetical protein
MVMYKSNTCIKITCDLLYCTGIHTVTHSYTVTYMYTQYKVCSRNKFVNAAKDLFQLPPVYYIVNVIWYTVYYMYAHMYVRHHHVQCSTHDKVNTFCETLF